MKKFLVRLECGHETDWRETPLDVAPHLPHVGGIAHCELCEQDEEIVAVEPARWIVEEEKGVTVFYDAQTGTWGCLGFESAQDAKEVVRS